MTQELREQLGYIIDLLDEFLDDDNLSDEAFHTLRPAIDIMNEVYDEPDESN